MTKGLISAIAALTAILFSASAYAADTYAFVTQTTNGSTFSLLDPATGKQVAGRVLGINTNTPATYSADGTIAFVADTDQFNHTVALIVYSVPAGKHLGSVATPNGFLGATTSIPGTDSIFASVRTGKTSAIYKVNGAALTAKVILNIGANAMAVSPDGGTLYISTGSALLSFNTTTFQQTASVLIAGIYEIAVTPDGSTLILGIRNVSTATVAEYDPKTMTITNSAPLNAFALSPDGSTLYTTVQTNGGLSAQLEQVSVATLTVVNSVASPSSTANIAISPDGSKLALVASVIVPSEIAFFNLPALTPGPVTLVGNACGVAFPTSAFVSVTNCGANTVDVVDITTGALKERYDAGPAPQSVLAGPHGSVLYVATLSGVWVLSTTTGNILSKVPFPVPYPDEGGVTGPQLALSAGGATLFAQYLGGVLEIATSTNQAIGPVPGIPAGFGTSAIATSSDGKYLFVAGQKQNDPEEGYLLLLDQSNGSLISMVLTPDAAGVLLVPSKDSANLYYEGGIGNVSFSIYDFNIASQSFTLSAGDFENAAAIVLSPDGTTLYAADTTVEAINTTTFAVTAIPSPVPAVGIAITPDGSKLVVTSANPELGVITIANPLIGATIPIGAGTAAISLR